MLVYHVYHTLYHGLLILPYTQHTYFCIEFSGPRASNFAMAGVGPGLARPGGRGVHRQIGIQGELLRWKTMGFNCFLRFVK